MALRKSRYSKNESGGACPAAIAPPEPTVIRKATPLAACLCPFPWVCPVVSAAVPADAEAAAGALPEAAAAVVAAPPAAAGAPSEAAAAVVAASPAAVGAEAAA